MVQGPRAQVKGFSHWGERGKAESLSLKAVLGVQGRSGRRPGEPCRDETRGRISNLASDVPPDFLPKLKRGALPEAKRAEPTARPCDTRRWRLRFSCGTIEAPIQGKGEHKEMIETKEPACFECAHYHSDNTLPFCEAFPTEVWPEIHHPNETCEKFASSQSQDTPRRNQ